MESKEESREQMAQAWQEVAAWLNRLPPERRAALKERIRHFNHDLGDRVGLVRSAEALLRRDAQESQAGCDPELLDIIRNAASDLYALLQMLRAFAQSIED